MKRISIALKKYCPVSIKDTVVFIAAMMMGIGVCVMLQSITTSDTHVPIIFVLVVLVIALTTTGYLYGTVAAVTSVFAVNYAFTYPYYKLDFSIYGYPLTFITFLGVGLASSTLAARHKEIERLKSETENERMRATLLRSISHDLRTPLTTISGSISAVLDNKNMKTELKEELLSNAKEDADWLYRMVENLLSITRVNGEKKIVKHDELIEEVLSESVVKFKKNNPNFQVDLKGTDEPVFIPMDAVLIEQVLLNLYENAKIHGHADKITITVRDYNEDEIGIQVRDNGTGIKKDVIDHLFDGLLEFGGNNNGDTSRFMGIGLAVCKTIVEAHGGKIAAYNIPNSGAEFIFSLPKGATDVKN